MTRRFPKLPLLAALAACGPSTPQTAPGPRPFTPPSSAAEPIVAPNVPVLEGLPQAVRIGLTVYVAGAVAAVRAAVLEGLDKGSPPAITIIGVAALPEPAMRVMLDGVAQLRSEFPDRTRMGNESRGGRPGRGGI